MIKCPFTHDAKYVNVNPNAHLNIVNGIFSNKPSMIAEKENSKFAEI